MRLADWFSSPAAGLAVSLGVTGTVVGQVPDSVRLSSATLVAQVVDSTGAAIADAEVMVLAGDSVIAKVVRSNAQGDVRLRNLPLGGPYTIQVRKIGYRRARAKGVHIEPGDTLYYRFELPPFVAQMRITGESRRTQPCIVLPTGMVQSALISSITTPNRVSMAALVSGPRRPRPLCRHPAAVRL